MSDNGYEQHRDAQLEAWGDFGLVMTYELEHLREHHPYLVGPAIHLHLLMQNSCWIAVAYSRRDRFMVREHLEKCRRSLDMLTHWLSEWEMDWQ